MKRLQQSPVFLNASLFLATVLLAASLLGCADNPIQEAKSPELKAQALYAEFVLAEEAAARLMQSPQVPDKLKADIQAAHIRVSPMAEALEDQRMTLAKLRINRPEDVPVALLKLNDLITQVTPLIQTFTTSTHP